MKRIALFLTLIAALLAPASSLAAGDYGPWQPAPEQTIRPVSPMDPAAERGEAMKRLYPALKAAQAQFTVNGGGYVDVNFSHRDLARAIERSEPTLGNVGVRRTSEGAMKINRVYVIARSTRTEQLTLVSKSSAGNRWQLRAKPSGKVIFRVLKPRRIFL